MSGSEWIDFQNAMMLIFQPIVGWGIALLIGTMVISALFEIVRDFGNWLNTIANDPED